MSGNCCVCSLPLSGKFIGMGDGSMKDGGKFAHAECYYRTLLATSQRELAEARSDLEYERSKFRTALQCYEGATYRREAAEARATASERQVEAMQALADTQAGVIGRWLKLFDDNGLGDKARAAILNSSEKNNG